MLPKSLLLLQILFKMLDLPLLQNLLHTFFWIIEICFFVDENAIKYIRKERKRFTAEFLENNILYVIVVMRLHLEFLQVEANWQSVHCYAVHCFCVYHTFIIKSLNITRDHSDLRLHENEVTAKLKKRLFESI